ncbi:MAG: hypothetical protein K6E70_13675, partial [Butyrivibrio sp.]|nr:hypothetical protein [Butyrivibrio sp.]
MTNEEAAKELEILKEDYWDDDGYGHETKQYDDIMLALDMAIEILEQEPCVGAISRQAAINIASGYCHPANIAKELAKLPSVQPKLTECEDAISRAETVQFLTNHSNDFEDVKIRMAFQTASSLVNNPHNLPSVYPKPKTGHWIPVSEGMPNEYADVICCTDAKEVFIATYLGKMNDGTDCFDDANGMMCEGDV